MKQFINKFKEEVISAAMNPSFIHHKWFIEYHLLIVEQIALELCNVYSKADRDIVILLLWLHDYGKIIDIDNEHSGTLIYGKAKLAEIGFSEDIIDQMLAYVERIDNTEDLNNAPIEVKIVSSADGASHLIGPFYQIYVLENPQMSIQQIMRSNIRKLEKDWNQKIVLPEIKKQFKERYDFLLEQNGKLPKQYLSS